MFPQSLALLSLHAVVHRSGTDASDLADTLRNVSLKCSSIVVNRRIGARVGFGHGTRPYALATATEQISRQNATGGDLCRTHFKTRFDRPCVVETRGLLVPQHGIGMRSRVAWSTQPSCVVMESKRLTARRESEVVGRVAELADARDLKSRAR